MGRRFLWIIGTAFAAVAANAAIATAQTIHELERSGYSELASVRVGDDVALRMNDGRDRFGTVLSIDEEVIVIDTGARVVRIARDEVKTCTRYPRPRCCCAAPAWSQNPDLPVLWISGGLGSGRMPKSRGTFGALEATIPFRDDRLVMARWSRYDEYEGTNEPRERGETVGLTLGTMARGPHWMASASAGLGYTRGVARGPLLDEGFPFRDRYRRIGYRAVGVLAEARAAVTWRFGGIGIAVLGDANPERQMIAAQGVVFIGLMPSVRARREVVP